MHKGLWGCVCCGLIACAGLSAGNGNLSEIQQHYQRAQEALHAHQDTIAIREFREILRLYPKNSSAHTNLGVIAFTHGDCTQAAQEFREALKL